MRTTFEIQRTTHALNSKEIIEKLQALKYVWNVEVDWENGLVSFEYSHNPILKRVRKKLIDMGYYVVNDTHHLDKNIKP